MPLGRRHAASTYPLFQHPESYLDMVRPGMAIFGAYPEPEFQTLGALDLRLALSLRGRVIYVKKVRAGDSVGYSRAYVAERDVYVATLPIEHTDGLPRKAGNAAGVRIGDKLYPLIGTVSASHSTAEIGPEPRVHIGVLRTFVDAGVRSSARVSAAVKTAVKSPGTDRELRRRLGLR